MRFTGETTTFENNKATVACGMGSAGNAVFLSSDEYHSLHDMGNEKIMTGVSESSHTECFPQSQFRVTVLILTVLLHCRLPDELH